MAKKYLRKFFVFLLIVTAQTALAGAARQIQSNIDKTIKRYDPNINVGIVVQSLTQNKILYQKNPNQLFMPASILKIFPAIAALSFLGPDYHFHTKILTKNPNIDLGVINNDLYLYFDGDPSLTKQDVNNLIKKLATLGLTTINNNIYIDDTIFDDSLLGAGWVWDDLNSCYAAPISAAMIDKNCFSIKLKPQKSEQPAVLVDDINYVSITNNIISKIPSNNCPIKLNTSNSNNYNLSGCIKTNSPPVNLSFAIRNVRLYAKNLLIEQLQTNNIKLNGSIEFKKTPIDTQLGILAEHESATLSEIIKPMLKKSDNTIADTIYKKLGAAFFNKQSSWQDGSKAIKNILEKKSYINFKEMYMDDGSGLSNYNLITPANLVAALSYAYHNETIRQIFTDSLSKAGIDGTLQSRMPPS